MQPTINKGEMVIVSPDPNNNSSNKNKGLIGIVTNIENSTYEVCTLSNAFVYRQKDSVQRKPLMPVEDACKKIYEYCGHHCNSKQLQFDIKTYASWEIPKVVTDNVSEEELDSHYNNSMDCELHCFMGLDADYGLDYTIPWVGHEVGEDWWTAGRNGGWLVIDPTHDYQSDIDEYYTQKEELENMRKAYKTGTLDTTAEEFIKEYKQLRKYQQYTSYRIRLFAEQVMFISQLIEHAKEKICEYYASMEPWQELLDESIEENADEIMEEFEEAEDLSVPDNAVKYSAVLDSLTNHKAQIEDYCLRANKLLLSLNGNYPLYAAWNAKVGEAIEDSNNMIDKLQAMVSHIIDIRETLQMLQCELKAKANAAIEINKAA